MKHITTQNLMMLAHKLEIVVPAFNIPYLPMVEPVIRALKDCNSVGLIMVARLEWKKFSSGSLEAVADEYHRYKHIGHTRLHLDHVPVIDEDDLNVNYMDIIKRAIDAGYESVMLDGSRLPLENNIACTQEAANLAHSNGVPLEAELGAVMGHENGPLPSYEELFTSGKGFTNPEEAKRFVQETDIDWLSVAIGNIHGAISAATKGCQKISAKLNIKRLEQIHNVTRIPLVLHGGTGIRKTYIMESIKHGITKINVATATRQPYEAMITKGVRVAQNAVYDVVSSIIKQELDIMNSATHLIHGGKP